MRKGVTAVLPCLNEAERIGPVLDVLTNSPCVDKTIVVDGGSTDGTIDIVKKYDVMLLIYPKHGKGGALKHALGFIDTDIVFMCDADLIGLQKHHVESLVKPVKENGDILTVAMLDKAWHFGSSLIKENLMLLPINGTRALRVEHLREASQDKMFLHWGIESVINHYCKKNKVKLVKVNLNGVMDVAKPHKKNYGWRAHLNEIVNVSTVRARIHVTEAIEKIKGVYEANLKGRL